MLVSKSAKICITPTRNPNASQWNIGCVGSQTQISHVGHVHFIFFVSISFALGSQFPVEYGLKNVHVNGLVSLPLAHGASSAIVGTSGLVLVKASDEESYIDSLLWLGTGH